MPPKKSVQRSEFHHVRMQEHLREMDGPSLVASSGEEQQQRLQGEQEEKQQHQKGQQSYFVPSLISLCADVIAENFADIAAADKLCEEDPKLYDMVIERLRTDLPLTVNVPRVRSDAYWRRCCEARWSFGQLSERSCGKLVPPEREGWKQFYLERVLSDYLTGLRSHDLVGEESQQLDRLCIVSREYVYALHLPCQTTRFDLYTQLLSRLPHLEHLRLTYGANNVGTSFEWDMMGFSESDAANVRYALNKYPPLRSLRLPNNRINSSLAKGILSGLVLNTTLRVLDLSSNRIDDDGVRQLALLLCRPDLPLEELYLHDNKIRGDGAAALGEALTMNTTLRVLNLRLNRIPDEPGGVALVTGLASPTALEVLDLSHNALGDATAQVLAEVLPKQTSLLSLNISGNKALGLSTGELLLQAVRENATLRFLDARSSGVAKECVAAMEACVESGVQAMKSQEVAAQEEEQRGRILEYVETKLAKTLCVL
ncbi:leucine-rich protein [Trypanosoma grayi]|uniref:leucine-rich protein n=1 Tax=Trypanosoma grayi TaxID=71804 RepID=UPI0004F48158|nr:leucine-rich protein [Trypanosoma grayi]KEG11148.1 leucine-rich protein [Trypanosoma grayi]